LGAAGGVIGSLTPMLREKEPKAVLAPGPYPTLKKGEKAKIGQKENLYVGVSSAAITTKCKEKEIAARWLDYGYSKEGRMLYNFGIEDVSYKMENGYPKYTDLIVKNPQNISFYNIANRYFRTSSGPYVQDRREYEQVLTFPEQREAIDIWSKPESAAWLPPILPTVEESKKMASIYTNISTYTEEKFLKFVMGQEPLTSFDKYVEEIKKMGLEDVLKIQQAALDRYTKR
jgi:putative aldouronate transport system substrate-binding protein